MTDRIKLGDLTSDQYDELCADLDRYEELQGEMNERAIDLTRRAQLAEAAIARVRALHYQDVDHCAICTTDFGRLSAPWPCPTIRTLDSKEPTP